MPDSRPDANDMMVDPNVTSEDMDAWLQELDAGGSTYDLSRTLPSLNSVAEPEPEPNPPTEPEPDTHGHDDETQEGTGEPSTPDDGFNINGTVWPREEIERLYNFDQYLRANPDAAQRVAQAVAPPVRTTEPPVPAPSAPTAYEAPTPPDYLDLEDPSQRFMWDNHVQMQKALHDRDERDKARWNQLNAERQEQTQRQAQVDMDSALTEFRTQHPNLNDDDIALIRQGAAPFVEGMMRQLPPVAALVRSMDAAAYMNPDLIPKLIDPTQQSQTKKQQSTTRKRNLGSISGAPRSAPKTEGRPAYTSDKDMVNQLAAAFAEQGFGNPNG